MGYSDHDNPPPPREPDLLDRTGTFIGLIVRLIGVALLCVGIAVALKVIAEAFQLYNQPQTIERFAQAVEQGSNLDAVFAPLAREPDAPARGSAATPPLRLSYFAAWVVVLFLLLVVSGIAMSVIAVGGRLALGDLSWKRRR